MVFKMVKITERKEKIRDDMLEYKSDVNIKESEEFTGDLDKNEFLFSNPTAFFFGVIFDQQVKAEKAWEAPYELKQRLGHIDVEKIAQMQGEELEKVFREGLCLHRFPGKTAKWIVNASKKIVEEYDGKTKNIWKDVQRPNDLFLRLNDFKGIGQKKGSMAQNILINRMDIEVVNKENMDISYDIHIRRVFLRTGLVNQDNKKDILEIARKLSQDYPGKLDFPAWHIGKNYCRPSQPNCKNCPLEENCEKNTDVKIKTP